MDGHRAVLLLSASNKMEEHEVSKSRGRHCKCTGSSILNCIYINCMKNGGGGGGHFYVGPKSEDLWLFNYY